MKYILLVLVFCVLSWSSPTKGANILYLSLMPSPSHHIWDKTLAMALRARGHQITFVTHSSEKSVENFTTIIFEGIYEKTREEYNFDDFTKITKLKGISLVYDWFISLAEWGIATKGFQELNDLVNKKPKFDLIIKDTLVGHYIYPIFEKLGNPPLIGTSQFGVQPFHTFYVGNDIHYAYNPVYMLPYTDKMSFCERVENYIYTNIYLFYRQYIYMPEIWKISQNYYGNDVTPYQEVEKQFSLLLANFDPVLDYPQSLPPAVIPVGGLHTKREKALPKDLQKFLDDSKEGVVLFSLGTNMLSKDLRKSEKQALIDGLGRIKQKVLWKYEEEITGLPKNIITRTWLPQNDILAHPNLKAFLTHAAALSTQEAMFHGVPVICLPFFADQHVITQKMVNRKMGRSLEYGALTGDIVYETVNDVVSNPEYKTNIELLSKRYNDQPEDPLTRAIWWIEYVHRQGGAQHLAVASRDIPFWKLNMLDMWAVVLAITLFVLYVVKKICCMFCSKSCIRNIDQKSKKTN